MITRLSAATAAALLLVLVGCSAESPAPASGSPRPKNDDRTRVEESTDSTDATPTPNPTPNPQPGEKLPKPPESAGACKLPNAQAQTVQAKFTQGTPPAATGGTLDGTYVVDDATVYLPNGARPAQSTGTVEAWGVFSNGNYNLSVKLDLTVSTIIGAQRVNDTTAGQGTFTVNGSEIVIKTSCEGSAPPAVKSIKFSDEGQKGTLIIESEQQGRPVYLVLKATKRG